MVSFSYYDAFFVSVTCFVMALVMLQVYQDNRANEKSSTLTVHH